VSTTDQKINPVVLAYETDPSNSGVKKFVRSLEKFGWNYQLIVEPRWRGFGRRLKKVIEKAKELKGSYSHCIHVDARDVLFQGNPSEFVAPEVPLLLAGEENLWPGTVKVSRQEYPQGTSIWRFAHSQYVLDLNYCDLMEAEEIEDTKDDQLHCHEIFFKTNRDNVRIDYECKYIQSIAFCANPWQKHFEVDSGRLYNIATKTYPLAVHGNGGTDMTWVPEY
jgi:hypothetical protein